MQTVPASEAIRQGQETFRVKQEVKTSGFGVEFDVSTKAIYVGPDSSFSEYSVIYFDPTRGLAATLATISVNRPYIGRLDSRVDLQPSGLTLKTSPSGKKIPQTGRLVVIPEDNFDLLSISSFDSNIIVFPSVDIIAYTSEGAPNIQTRSNFALDTAVSTALPPATTAYWIPFYGRKSLTVRTASVGNPTDPVTTILGVSWTNKKEIPYQTIIQVPTIGPSVFHYETSVGVDKVGILSGGFDYIAVLFTLNSNNPEDFDAGGQRLTVRTSDEIGGV